MKFQLKVLACGISILGSTAVFAESVEQRISTLEQQLNELKTQQQNEVQQTTSASSGSSLFSDTDIKVYGIVRMDGSLDLKDTAGSPFVSNQLPSVNQTPAGHRSAFTLTATRLGMDLSKNVNDTSVKGKIEMDFWDGLEGNGKLRIRHAYVDFNNWLIGQTVSGMSNLETLTESVDYTLFMGYSWTRNPQVRYNFDFSPQHNLKLAAEYVDSRSSEIPALTAKYTFKQDSLTALAQGFVHEKRATVNGDDIDKLSWGAGLGLKYQMTPVSTLQGHAYHVEGDQKFVSYAQQSGDQVNGFAAGGDFSVNNAKNDLDLNKFNTYVLGYSHKLSEQWRMNVVGSLFDYDDSTAYARNNPTLNKKLTDLAANVFYTPLKNIDIGMEYHHGKRESFDGSEFDVSRLNFVTMYKF